MVDPQLTVVLPSYNAGGVITDSVTSLSAALTAGGLEYEIIVVDDGSRDKTAERLGQMQDARMRVVTMPQNRGKGAAIKQGMALARGAYVVTTDVDLPYGPDAVLHCYHTLLHGALLAVGDRTLPESRRQAPVPLVRRLGSCIYMAFIRLLFPKVGVYDTQCGLKGFHHPLVRQIPRYCKMQRFSFDLELVVFAAVNQIPMARIPVNFVTEKGFYPRIFIDATGTFRDLLCILLNAKRGRYKMGGDEQVTRASP